MAAAQQPRPSPSRPPPRFRPARRPLPRTTAVAPPSCPAGYLGAGRDDREFWLVGGHVYSDPPSGGRATHVCRLAAYNRLHKA